MAVFRVERNTGYTVMSNHHLRNKELSLKAKGLLSQMLSLPEDWDYTLAGLSHINREKIDAIREAVKELEKAGYIVRSRERDEKGRLRGADYVIYEQPQPREPEAATSGGQPPILDLPTLENPTWGGIPTGITQNVKDLLSSREVENIFENSDFVYMLNQAQGDREILAKQLNISQQQMTYVTHSDAGEGLIFYGNVILPFIDRFPQDTELYRVMTTKPGEVSA